MSGRRTRALGTVFLLAMLAPAEVATTARGQADDDPPPGNVDLQAFGRGTQAFRRILFDRGFRAAEGTEPAERTLLVVLGTTDVLAAGELGLREGLRAFVEAGGALLVATDRRTHPALAEAVGVRVPGDQLVLEDPSAGYLGLRECPTVQAALRGDPPLFRSPSLPGQPAPPRVATNMPGRLALPARLPPGLSVLALLPQGCTTGSVRFGALAPAFAVGGRVGAGAVVVMADHSVFINDMMLRPDNGNLDFAYRVAEWFRPGPAGPRDRVLYYEDGEPRRDFDIPLKDVPLPELPPPEALVPLINGTLHGLERENAFNELLLHFVPRDNLWRGLLVVGAGALALYGLVHLVLFRHRPDPTLPQVAALVHREGPSRPLMEHRLREQMRQAHFGEAAQTLAAALFADAGLDPARAGARAPVPEVAGGWWQGWLWRRRVRRLWEVARGGPRAAVSRRGLASVARNVRRLEAALADGTVALAE